jgi:RNA polymerase sigma factor (sigma-70 family)
VRQVGLEIEEFERFFTTMRPRLVRAAMRTLDAETADEAAVSTLHTIWTKNVAAPRDASERLQLQALSFRILDGHVRNAQRGRSRRARLLDTLVDHHGVSRTVEPDVAESVEHDDAELAVRELLDELSPKEREVVTLVIDGFTVGEIAVVLGKRPGAISMRLNRARRHLERAMGRDDR